MILLDDEKVVLFICQHGKIWPRVRFEDFIKLIYNLSQATEGLPVRGTLYHSHCCTEPVEAISSVYTVFADLLFVSTFLCVLVSIPQLRSVISIEIIYELL